ncbi:hypothetical protein C0989_005249, partial [Termitomyces sp. Mn162]
LEKEVDENTCLLSFPLMLNLSTILFHLDDCIKEGEEGLHVGGIVGGAMINHREGGRQGVKKTLLFSDMWEIGLISKTLKQGKKGEKEKTKKEEKEKEAYNLHSAKVLCVVRTRARDADCNSTEAYDGLSKQRKLKDQQDDLMCIMLDGMLEKGEVVRQV